MTASGFSTNPGSPGAISSSSGITAFDWLSGWPLTMQAYYNNNTKNAESARASDQTYNQSSQSFGNQNALWSNTAEHGSPYNSPAYKAALAQLENQTALSQAQLAQVNQGMNLKNQAFSFLQNYMGDNSNKIQPIDMSSIQGLLGGAGNVNPNIRQGDVQGVINNYQDLLRGPKSQMAGAQREQAMAGLNQQYLSSQHDLRATQGRGMPAMTSQARISDLLNARMQSQGQMEQGLATNQYNQRGSLLGSLNSAVGGDISRQQSAQGANQASALQQAQINLSGQQANQQSQEYNSNMRNQLMNSLLSIGGF